MGHNFKKGDKLKIKASVKKELLNLYNHSEGMSGVSPEWINSTMTFIRYYGSNAVVLPEGRMIELSLNHSRFIKK